MTFSLVDRIDAVLPQTQCRQCGYDGCRPYAEAVAGGEAINRCAPGGDAGIAAIATISGRPAIPLAAAVAAAGPLLRAVVDESACIGCTLCMQDCPVDAIAGGPKRMHVVLAALCTGCGLCLPPCPVNCIAMVPAGRAWSKADADAARLRYDAHRRRGKPRDRAAGAATMPDALPSASSAPELRTLSAQERRQAATAALARARARRQAA